MKPLIKDKIVSIAEAADLIVGYEEVVYEDIEQKFSPEDFNVFNELYKDFVAQRGGRSNMELWNLITNPVGLDGLNLVSVLNRIEELISKYGMPGLFLKIWRVKLIDDVADDSLEYSEMSW